ncbi:hypothetical protein K402DRAFT_366462 [Aulographum hederae CBS 113979]|uniref:Atos-like conserved domain-containing protein n=1 Tax=Aulographum hederae CBS 113979 TaxID=1176131 RepID=A0A6G1HGR4_9PEZI|nr:hypothetical protein K402DRAFT_366462 [Aulographum hederae CBS 113979]
MPIFHDTYDPAAEKPHSPTEELRELRRQDIGYVGSWNGAQGQHHAQLELVRVESGGRRQSPVDRAELIERIKRGDSPTWTTKQNPTRPTTPRTSPKPNLPLAADIKEGGQENGKAKEEEVDNQAAGLEIERPRSALHSGDFRQPRETFYGQQENSSILSTSPVAPWHQEFPRKTLNSTQYDDEYPHHHARSTNAEYWLGRSRAASQLSTSGNFVYMPPTSPLVQQSNNSDLDLTAKSRPHATSGSPERNNRRHTFSPQSFQVYRSSLDRSPNSSNTLRGPSSLRKEGSFPYQAHQPRRSLNAPINLLSASTPQTPQLRPRVPSISSENAPLHHAPMVGSYEESILRGRMSTLPSRPLNFVAQIGVLGKGDCKASLRCPPHVTIPFPAVFYSYGSGSSKSSMENQQPSPYVGHIDIEHTLRPADEDGEGKKRRRYTAAEEAEATTSDPHTHEEMPDPRKAAMRRKKEKLKRRSQSPKSPPGGSYRIPQVGQLQIVIKNPNKTAVKLFLVPYDLSDMEPGQKTFIRQRSYSAGPIIDMPISSRKNLGTDRPEASLACDEGLEDPRERPVLRYLVHLHICCTGKGRHFLYKSIRVVFANRVPDGKEKLRNEVQLPEPRYSTYKPTRDSAPTPSQTAAMSSASATLVAEKERRRRSAGVPISYQRYGEHEPFNLADLDSVSKRDSMDWSRFGSAYNASSTNQLNTFDRSPIKPIPFTFSGRDTTDSRPHSAERMDLDSPFKSTTAWAPRSTSLNMPGASTPLMNLGWERRMQADFSSSSASDGLLARRLRGLDVQKEKDFDHE